MKNIIILITILLSGCASIVSSDLHKVRITSNQSDVNYKVLNQNNVIVAQGKTPANVNLESSNRYFSGEKYTIEASKEGFQNGYTDLDATVSNWYLWGNLFLGGIIGWFIVDPLTGAMYELPEKVTVSVGDIKNY